MCVYDLCDYVIKFVVKNGTMIVSGFSKYTILDASIPGCILDVLSRELNVVEAENYLWYFRAELFSGNRHVNEIVQTLERECCSQ